MTPAFVTIQQNKLPTSIPPVLQEGSECNEQGGVFDGLTAMPTLPTE